MAHREIQVRASIAEIIGAVAIVVSLIYVAYELRENNRILHVNSRQVLSEQDLRFYETAIDPQVVARAVDKVERGEQLSSLERSQLMRCQGLNFRIFEHAFFLDRNDALDIGEWERYQRIIRNNICGNEFAQQMWAGAGSSWDSDFRQIVENESRSCSQ